MREADEQAGHMFSYVSPEQRVPTDHPLRAVRVLTDEALASLSQRFASLYATTGRPSIPPEQLLRVLALQVLYTHYRAQSERLLVPARSRSEMRLICSSLSRLEIIKERSRLFAEDWNREVSRDIPYGATKRPRLVERIAEAGSEGLAARPVVAAGLGSPGGRRR